MVYKCLTQLKHFPIETEEIPCAYLEERRFWDRCGVRESCKLSGVLFRVVINLYYMKFLKNYTSVGKYITHSANALSACNKAIHELTAGHEFTKILWTVVIPTRVKKSPNGVLRDRFHSTKRFPMMDWKNNIRFLTVLKILQKYTVEDPIALLKCLYPSLSPNEPYEQSLVYHVLNAHINWFTYNRKQLDVCTETFFYDETCEMDDSFDVRCRNCLKLLTLRVKDTVAHKTVNVMFSTDTHTLVSGCCGAPPVALPLVCGDTKLIVSTGGSVRYTPYYNPYSNKLSVMQM